MLAALAHLPSMALNGHAWRILLPRARRPGLGAMTANVWIRESVNGLLPVARIGGEIASYRLLRGEGVAVAPAAASLMVDMAISILSQLGLRAARAGAAGLGGRRDRLGRHRARHAGRRGAAGRLHPGAAGRHPERLARGLNAIAAGRFSGFAAHSARIDRMTRRLWRVRGAIAGLLPVAARRLAAGALEIWLALYFLGHPVGLAEALAIEAMIQAVSSAAFLVPGALGLQEAGFLGLGLLLGLPAEVAAALAIARRLRDLIVFLPGLLAWVWAERRMHPRLARIGLTA